MTSIERTTSDLTTRQAFCEQLDGHRLKWFKAVGIPDGWVIDGRLSPDIWKCMENGVIPLKPGGRFWGRPKKAAGESQKEIAKLYGGEVVMLMVPDFETEEGYSASFVLTDDLKSKTAGDLRDEMGRLSGRKDAFSKYLSIMKRTAFMAMTGQSDTK